MEGTVVGGVHKYGEGNVVVFLLLVWLMSFSGVAGVVCRIVVVGQWSVCAWQVKSFARSRVFCTWLKPLSISAV